MKKYGVDKPECKDMEMKEMRLIDKLERLDGTKRMVEECMDVVRKSEGVIIFGAGVGGRALYEIIRDRDLTNKILAFSDNNEMKYGKTYCDEHILIEEPKSLLPKYGSEAIVIIASSAYDLIRRQLLGYGIPGKNIYLYNFAFMDVYYSDCAFIYDNIENFERAYEKMADDKSCRIYECILNYRITKQEKYLLQMNKYVDDEHYQYFDDALFDFQENEIFLDVGAYTGDTFNVFNEVYGEWKGYIGLEADPEMYRILKTCTDNSALKDKIELINAAAWNEDTTLVFSSNPGSSTLSDGNDGMIVRAITGDNTLLHKGVSFIKMDIEGAEYEALCGMKTIIQTNKPILAICVYHRRDDFYRLTDLIGEIAPASYSFFMRQYRYTPTETVCYAIPKERLKIA